MLYPRIDEVTTDKRTGETYVRVRFWKTEAARAREDTPFLVEDFVMPLRPTGTRLIDPDDPDRGTEEFARDLPAEIRGNISRYIERAEKYGYEGDNTSGDNTPGGGRTAAPFSVEGRLVREAGKFRKEPRERDESDPHDVLAKPEVTDLRDKDLDVGARP